MSCSDYVVRKQVKLYFAETVFEATKAERKRSLTVLQSACNISSIINTPCVIER